MSGAIDIWPDDWAASLRAFGHSRAHVQTTLQKID